MPSTSYSTADIPRELQRLIDRTDRGIEQLYTLAGHNAKLTGRSTHTHHRAAHLSSSSSPLSASYAQTRAGRDAYYYNHAPAEEARSRENRHRTGTAHRGVAPEANGHDSSRRQRQPERPSISSTEGDEDWEEEGEEEGGSFDGAYSNKRPHRPLFHNTNAAAPRHGAAPQRRKRASSRRTAAFSAARATPNASRSASPSSATPHRTAHYSAGTSFSSPASLTKPPPRVVQPDLPSPSSFLSSSQPHVSGLHHNPPPWHQRQQQQQEEERRSFSPYGGSPFSTGGKTAYRTHLAAQQATQRPPSHLPAAAAAGRTLVQRSGRLRSPLFAMTPGNSHAAESSSALFDSEADTSVASAGMRSQFGRRWEAVFEDMVVEAPQPPPRVAAAAADKIPRRKMASTQAATSQGEESDGEPSRESGESEKVITPRAAAAAATSSSFHAAAAAIATRHHSSPLRASPNTSELVGATTTTPSATDARLIDQLRAELRAKDEAMLQLRMNHAREVAEVRQSLTLERTSAAKCTADELATTYGIQQQLLQTSLQTERERVVEAEEQLRLTRREAAQRRLDLEDAMHALEVLRSKHTTLTTAHQELMAQSTQWRTQAETATSALRQLEGQEKLWKAKEADWQTRERQQQTRLEGVEARLVEQEASAQAVLAQVEAEFTQTAQSYQDLLAEATKRMAYLEKSHRKYKLLKESHALLTTDHTQLIESAAQARQRHETECASLRSEVQELHRQLHARAATSQEATDSYQETLRDYKRRLELQEASAAEHAKTLQQHVDTANHTIELLRSQLEGVKQELLAEQTRSQQQQMEAAQAELQAREALADQQRSAAAYKQRSDDVISQQKRQLKEKDTKLQALAASAAEPVQRLREQLEDERGRRARMEEQLRSYKRKAKEAEEQALAEMRREQLRTALLTPAAAAASSSSSAPLRLLRSATATPSARSSPTPRLNAAGVESTYRTASVFAAEGRPTAAVVLGPSPSTAVLNAGSRPRGGRAAEVDPLQAPPSPPSFQGEPALRRTQPADGSAATAPERKPRGVQPSPTDVHIRQRGATTGAAAVDELAVSPNATVQSLSGISRSSPCTSTVMGEVDIEHATAAAGQRGYAGQVSSAEESDGRDVEGEERVALPALPWYAQRPVPQRVVPPAAEVRDAERFAVSAASSVAEGLASTTQVYTDATTEAHEQRMRTFHSSALEVMRRFAGSRNEALAKCADIVKQTAAERRRDVGARALQEDAREDRGRAGGGDRGGGAARAAMAASDSDSDDA